MNWTKFAFGDANKVSDADREREEIKAQLRGAVAEMQSVVSRLNTLIQSDDDGPPKGQS